MGMRWLPLILLSAVGMCSQPLLVLWLPGVVERFGFTAVQRGLLASLELMCLAVASIAWATVSRPNRSVMWLAGALGLSLAANVASFLAPDAAVFIVARVISGACLGMILADVTGQAARTANPHRVFSFQQLGLIAFLSVCFATAPKAIVTYGAFAPFLYLAVLSGVALASLIWLGKEDDRADASAVPAAGARGPSATSAAVGMALGALTLTYFAQGAIWPYAGDAAREAGVSLELMGQILAIGAILNLLAPIIAERIGRRWGRAIPLLAGYAGLSIAIILLSRGDGLAGFAAGAIVLNLSLLFLTPFLLNILAAVDPSGRSASAAPAFFTFGAAIGPALAGLMIGQAGFAATGAGLAGAALCGLVLAMLSAFKAPRLASQGA